MMPFAPPAEIEEGLRPVLRYWEGLRRAGNDMPFSDDLKPSGVPDMAGRLLFIDAFDKPERFRFDIVGRELSERYGAEVVSRFVHEIEPRTPFEFLNAQCSVTAEARAPTYYRHDVAVGHAGDGAHFYARLLLPSWGEGGVHMLLGAVAWMGGAPGA
jgi:hypothetical protein